MEGCLLEVVLGSLVRGLLRWLLLVVGGVMGVGGIAVNGVLGLIVEMNAFG